MTITESEKMDAILEALTDTYPGLAEHLRSKFEAPVKQAEKSAEDTARQVELRAAYLKELAAGKGSFTQQFNTKQKFLRLGYNPDADPNTPEAQWQKAADVETQRRRDALDELEARKAGPVIKPEDESTYEAYRSEMSKCPRGNTAEFARIKRKYRKLGLDV